MKKVYSMPLKRHLKVVLPMQTLMIPQLTTITNTTLSLVKFCLCQLFEPQGKCLPSMSLTTFKKHDPPMITRYQVCITHHHMIR